MKNGGGQRAVDIGITECLKKVFHRARAAGGDQRHAANVTDFFQLRQIVTVTHAVLVHHIQDDFPRAALLYLLHPIQRLPLRHAGTVFIAGILVNMIFPRGVVKPGINPDDNALYAKTVSQTGNQRWVSQRRGVDRDLIRPERKNFGGVVN